MSLKYKVTAIVIISILQCINFGVSRSVKARSRKLERSKVNSENAVSNPNELLKRSVYGSIGYDNFYNNPVVPAEGDTNYGYYPNDLQYPHHNYHNYPHGHHFHQFSHHDHHINRCLNEGNPFGGYNSFPYESNRFEEYPETHQFQNHHGGFDHSYDSSDPHHILHNNNILDLTDGFNEHGDKIGTVFPLLPDLINPAPYSTIDGSCYHCWNDCNTNEYLHHGSALGYPFMLPPIPFVMNPPLVHDDSDAEDKGKKENKEEKKDDKKKDDGKKDDEKKGDDKKDDDKKDDDKKDDDKKDDDKKDDEKNKNIEKADKKDEKIEKKDNNEKTNEKEEKKSKKKHSIIKNKIVRKL